MPHQPPTTTLSQSRSWHNNDDDRLTRKLMILRLRRLHPVLAGTNCTAVGSHAVVVPSLVQRLEWMLYNAAHSMHEYTHEQTLERRVQALVTQLEPKVVTEWRQQDRNNSKKRDRDDTVNDPVKRLCLVHQRSDTAGNKSIFLLENDDNLVRFVLSFLSGRTVLCLRSVNRFMMENALTMMRTLHLETHSPALQHYSSGTLTKLLLNCYQLTTLVITSKLRDEKGEQRAGLMVRRRPSLNRQDGRLKNGFLTGELMLRDITSALERGACPMLEELDLGSPLDYFAESDDVLRCLEAFATRRRKVLPQRVIATGLQCLRLDSTYLGDTRLSRLAEVFECTADRNCFSSLKTLVLRNNFIGEAGCRALLRMLCCLPELQVLDVSGNILTDLDALALADWISNKANACEHDRGGPIGCYEVEPNSCNRREVQLRTLLLHDNFIGPEALEALSLALSARLILT